MNHQFCSNLDFGVSFLHEKLWYFPIVNRTKCWAPEILYPFTFVGGTSLPSTLHSWIEEGLLVHKFLSSMGGVTFFMYPDPLLLCKWRLCRPCTKSPSLFMTLLSPPNGENILYLPLVRWSRVRGFCKYLKEYPLLISRHLICKQKLKKRKWRC